MRPIGKTLVTTGGVGSFFFFWGHGLATG